MENNKIMIDNKLSDIQDTFLNYVQKHNIFLTIFLINGVKLQGIVTGFDATTILLKRDTHSQLVYKHAISTLMPQTPLPFFEDNSSENGIPKL